MRSSLTLAVGVTFAVSTASPAADWPQFRGPTGDGHYVGKSIPTEWGPDRNVAWKVAVPGQGWSSPIIWQGRVYLSTAVKSNTGWSLQALAIDGTTGKLLWQRELFTEDATSAPKAHAKNSHASPTPVTDGKRIYVHFGHLGTAALDLDGKIVWKNSDLKYAPVHGNGGSPIVVGDRLIFSCDGSDTQFVVALDTATGTIAWKTPRGTSPRQPFSFATPHLITVDGRPQVISPGSDIVAGHRAPRAGITWPRGATRCARMATAK